jgi:hypothetical protein
MTPLLWLHCYDSHVVILGLLKWAGVAEDESTDASGGGHPRGVVDAEEAAISDETVTIPEGPSTTDEGVGLPVDAIVRFDEPEV